MNALLTVKELSEILKVSEATIYRWVHYDFIPHIKIGGAVRFDEEAVQKWLRAKETRGRTKIALEFVRLSRE